MAEATLDMLMKMVQRVIDTQRDHSTQFRETISRLSQVEHGVSTLHQDVAILHGRVDHLSERVDRVEKRLEIA